jgi:hypothetical protein
MYKKKTIRTKNFLVLAKVKMKKRKKFKQKNKIKQNGQYNNNKNKMINLHKKTVN